MRFYLGRYIPTKQILSSNTCFRKTLTKNWHRKPKHIWTKHRYYIPKENQCMNILVPKLYWQLKNRFYCGLKRVNTSRPINRWCAQMPWKTHKQRPGAQIQMALIHTIQSKMPCLPWWLIKQNLMWLADMSTWAH